MILSVIAAMYALKSALGIFETSTEAQKMHNYAAQKLRQIAFLRDMLDRIEDDILSRHPELMASVLDSKVQKLLDLASRN